MLLKEKKGIDSHDCLILGFITLLSINSSSRKNWYSESSDTSIYVYNIALKLSNSQLSYIYIYNNFIKCDILKTVVSD